MADWRSLAAAVADGCGWEGTKYPLSLPDATSARRSADTVVEPRGKAGGEIRQEAGYGGDPFSCRDTGIRGHPEKVLEGAETGPYACGCLFTFLPEFLL